MNEKETWKSLHAVYRTHVTQTLSKIEGALGIVPSIFSSLRPTKTLLHIITAFSYTAAKWSRASPRLSALSVVRL